MNLGEDDEAEDPYDNIFFFDVNEAGNCLRGQRFDFERMVSDTK